ncbi:MAG TPA: hypothetical protein VKA30_12880 [Actinomycetota bacterium]|nr:hypothetical protein [Actinomycetota bacterium]
MLRLIVLCCVAGLAAAACSSSNPPPISTSAPPSTTAPATVAATPSGYRPHIDPANFVEAIDNPYFPLVPGTRFVYAVNGGARDVVEVTNQTKVLGGVTCVAVRDTLTEEGRVVEKTTDWYAQDRQGNVWYFGEDTAEYGKNGQVTSREGSWRTGVDGAFPGFIMPANPQVPDSYRQEYYAGHAEDMAWVVSITDRATVPFGSYTGVVRTVEWTPLEPDVYSEKYYAPGVGLIKEQDVAGGDERVALVNETPA